MATKADRDAILANEQRIKDQKQIVQQLHRQLKAYNDAFRHFINAQKVFYETLDNLCESNWELKGEFSKSLQALGNIAENGARNLETIPVEETIVFRDQFAPYEKEIQDYKEKQKIADAAERKHIAYSKKKAPDADELRKLELATHEKKTSLGISRRKLTDELPTFYKSRMDFYSAFWRSVFQIRSDVARAECETFDQLTELVRRFDDSRATDAHLNPTYTACEYHAAPSVQGGGSVASTDPVDAHYAYATESVEPAAATVTAGQQQQRQPNGQQTPSSSSKSIRRVPTFGGHDMSEDSVKSRPAVPRRSSFRGLPSD